MAGTVPAVDEGRQFFQAVFGHLPRKTLAHQGHAGGRITAPGLAAHCAQAHGGLGMVQGQRRSLRRCHGHRRARPAELQRGFAHVGHGVEVGKRRPVPLLVAACRFGAVRAVGCGQHVIQRLLLDGPGRAPVVLTDDRGRDAECNKAVPGFKTEEGETCFEMLERLARANAVMLTSDGDGRLVITRAGTHKAAAALQMGGNLLRLALSSSMKDRFSEVTVKGQSAGSDTWDGPGNAQAKGTATDPNVPRYRPLTIIAEQEEFGSATTRARHEVAVRYGKGHQARALVNGWYAGTELWQPNRLADILDSSGQAMATWLIVNVSWHMDDRGCLTELSLSPREAYELLPEMPKGAKGKKGKEASLWLQ